MLSLVQSPESLALSELQEGDFGGHEPAGEVSEDEIVPERNEVLELPEDRAGVTVVVVPEREILGLGSGFEEGLERRAEY